MRVTHHFLFTVSGWERELSSSALPVHQGSIYSCPRHFPAVLFCSLKMALLTLLRISYGRRVFWWIPMTCTKFQPKAKLFQLSYKPLKNKSKNTTYVLLCFFVCFLMGMLEGFKPERERCVRNFMVYRVTVVKECICRLLEGCCSIWQKL